MKRAFEARAQAPPRHATSSATESRQEAPPALDRAVVENAFDSVITADSEGLVIEFNRAAEHTFGYSRAEALGRDLADLILPPSLRERHRNGFVRAATGSPESSRRRFTLTAMRADGTEFPAEVAMARTSERPQRFTGYIRDLTEPRRGLKAVSQLAALVDASVDPILSKDLDGRIMSWNPAAERLYGYAADEAIGRHISLIIPSELLTDERRMLLAVERGEPIVARETTRRTKDGQLLEICLNVAPLRDDEGRVTGAVAIGRDITEDKSAEQALIRSERLLAESQRLARIGSWEWDVAGDLQVGSEELYRIYGVEPAELSLAAVVGLAHPDERERVRETIERSLRERRPYDLETRIVRPDGEVRVVQVYGEVVLDADGEPALIRGTSQDITERALAEEARRRSDERYRQIVETTTEGVWMIDEAERTTFVNRRMAELLGCEREEMLGTSLFDYMDSDLVPEARADLERGRDGEEQARDFTFLRRDGTELTVFLSANSLFDDSGEYRGVVAMMTDISERLRAERDRRRLEVQLLQAQRLDSIGQLAGGIAHDFNNLLAVIGNYASFVYDDLPADSRLREDVAEISHATDRAAILTRQLLVFSRRDAVKPEVVSLNEIAAGLERFLQRTLDEDVVLRLDISPAPWSVKADVSQIEQVLVNLALNARDAMPTGGELTIEIKNLELSSGSATGPADAPPGRYVRVAVTDTGRGMSKETAARAFEPFFSTKPRDKGTGLGLATTYGIVKQSGGEIEIHSEPGRGTSVEILLPALDEPVSRRAAGAAMPSRAGRGETVLVVEDEPAVRELTCRILSEHGYRPLGVGDPSHAVTCTAADGAVDLLLTDVVMPDMPGPQLVERVRELRPGIAVLYMSGYTGRRDGLDEEVLDKPFTATQLLRKVGEVLNPDE